ncbi:MAG: DNA binding protein [Microviridae sp. ctjyu33]|nr:MAG: DNA binding protein [Microviridae sp. ctjyu33]
MILKVFTVYDSKVEAFLPPFFMKSKGEAVRGFTEVCNDSKSNFFKYPEDYTLFEVGSFDDATGKFDLHKTLVSIGLGVEFKKVADAKA